MNILAIIPARGGSKGIPRKNVRLLDGKPLISYSILSSSSSAFNIEVVVSTDDDEISYFSSKYGAFVVKRPAILAKDEITLDPVIYHATKQMEENLGKSYDIVITLQPTSPLLKVKTLDAAIEFFLEDDYDTLLSVINKPHLSWSENQGRVIPNYKERLNRQSLPKNYLETGAFMISKRDCVRENTRMGKKIGVYEVSTAESIDIDSVWDWWVAEKELKKKNILIRLEGYAEIGLGHIYRGLLLAYNLIDHNVKFVISHFSEIGKSRIKDSHFLHEIISKDDDIFDIAVDFNCDIIINDILDTSEDYVKLCKSTGARVVNFEDLGKGAEFADAVINDLYSKSNALSNHYWGAEYYCLRDEFLFAIPADFRETVKEILVIFGGTDPSNLTKKVLEIVQKIELDNIHFTFILGMGYTRTEELKDLTKRLELNIDIVQDVKNMTHYMSKADIAISSQGRTMLELTHMKVPTILLAQNKRELSHEYGGFRNGFINLGLGSEVNDKTILQTIIWLVESPQIRKQMKNQMINIDFTQGIERVKKIILNQF